MHWMGSWERGVGRRREALQIKIGQGFERETRHPCDNFNSQIFAQGPAYLFAKQLNAIQWQA